jgi:defensin alpha
MKTLALLAAILLLALQAQSDPLPARVEEASAQEQMEEEDPVTTISITGVESSDFRDAGKIQQDSEAELRGMAGDQLWNLV